MQFNFSGNCNAFMEVLNKIVIFLTYYELLKISTFIYMTLYVLIL